jgi:hypothetical protein
MLLNRDFKEFAGSLNAEGVEYGVQLPIIGIEDFKTNKRSRGRPKDLADLDALEPPRGG